MTVAPGADAEDLVRRVDGAEGVSIRLRSIEKRDGRMVATIKVRGRPEAAVRRATARLVELSEVTDLVVQ
jgi:hypothetical protein